MIIVNKNINIGVILQTVGSYFCFCLIKHIHSYQTMSENMPKNNVKLVMRLIHIELESVWFVDAKIRMTILDVVIMHIF